MKHFFSILMIIFMFSPSPAFAKAKIIYDKDQNGFKILDFDVKKQKLASGYYYLGVKVKIRNNDTPVKLYLTVKGVDRDGFQVDWTIITGTFKAKETKTLTEQMMIKKNDYRDIKEWHLVDIKKYSPY